MNQARLIGILSLVVTLLAGATALAQPKQRVIEVGEVTIVGRVQKPIAVVDIARIQPKLTLAELKQPFLDRIERALYHEPF